ncbi:MAG TPA: DUF192 domain-containing protein [Opitutaceae bacterium]|nr:DUF192 domain-containing protein [Opitutaceae bacterium]
MKNANLVSCLKAGLMLVVGVALVLAGCNKDGADQPVAPKTVADYFPIKVGERTVRMQLAVLSAEQQQGLMFRRDLGPDDGMLFPYRTPQVMSFWMRNTPTPLDIGFFDADGVLQEVYQMYPHDETSVRSRSDRLKYALEMNQGWYRDNGVRPGAKLDVAAFAAALKARGFDPAAYGLTTK